MVGCEYREICDAFTDDEYQKSEILSENFRIKCNSYGEEPLCPIYDIYSYLFKRMGEGLDKIHKDFESMIEGMKETCDYCDGLDKNPENMDALKKEFDKKREASFENQ